jgi:hypothetical protein
MARLNMTAFGLNSVAAGATGMEMAFSGGSPTISASVTRPNGTHAMRISSLASGTRKGAGFQGPANGALNTSYYNRAYLRIATAPTAENRIMAIIAGGGALNATHHIWITLDNNRLLRLYDEDGQIGSASAALTLDTWYRLELLFKRTDATTGDNDDEVRARIDGVEFAGASNRDIGGTFLCLVLGGNLAAEAQTTGDWFFTDVAINDSTGTLENTWPGECKGMVYLRPNGAGSNADWTRGGADSGANWSQCDEAPTPNDATDYVRSNTASQVDDYALEATPATIGSTDIVRVVAAGCRFRGNGADGTNAQFALRLTAGGSTDESAAINPSLNAAWRAGTRTIAGAPALVTYNMPGASTTAWTKADLDAAEIGMRLATVDDNPSDVTAIWALVEFDESAGGGDVRTISPVTIALQTESVRTVPATISLSSGSPVRTISPVTISLTTSGITLGALTLWPNGESVSVAQAFSGDEDDLAGKVDFHVLTTSGATLGATSIAINSSGGLPVSLPIGTVMRWWNGVSATLTATAALSATSVTVSALSGAIPSGTGCFCTDVMVQQDGSSEWHFQPPLHRTKKLADAWLFTDLFNLEEGAAYTLRLYVLGQVVTEEFTTRTLTQDDPASWTPTRYVDSLNGLDTNDGTTPGTAWKTINKARLSVSDNEIIELHGHFRSAGAAAYWSGAGLKMRARYPACDDQTDSPMLGDGHGEVPAINAGNRTVIHGPNSMAPTGQAAVDPHGTYQGAGLWKRCNGAAGQAPAIVGANGITYTDIWVWQGGKVSGSLCDEIFYSETRDGEAKPVGMWWTDTRTVHPHKSTVQGWAAFVHTNDTYRWGAYSTITGTDIYLLFAEGVDPNTYWWDISYSSQSHLYLQGPNNRVSGLMFKGASWGVFIGSDLISPGSTPPRLDPDATTNNVVDHCLFSGFRWGVWLQGINASGLAVGAYNGAEPKHPRNTLIEHCRFIDHHKRAKRSEGYVVENRHLGWQVMKAAPYFNGAPYVGGGRGIGYAENTAIMGKGTGWRGLVIRHTYIDGCHNGLASPTSEGYLHPFGAGFSDVYECLFRNMGDDPLEPEGNHTGWKVWNCRIEDSIKGLISLVPQNWGTITLYNIVSVRCGNQGQARAFNTVADPRAPGTAQYVKNAGFTWHQTAVSSQQQPSRILYVNITGITDRDHSGSSPAMGFGPLGADGSDWGTGSGLPASRVSVINSIFAAFRSIWTIAQNATASTSNDQHWSGAHQTDFGHSWLVTSDTLRGLKWDGFQSYTSAAVTGSGSVADVRSDYAAWTAGGVVQPANKRLLFRRVNSKLVGGGWQDFSFIDRSAVLSEFDDYDNGVLNEGSGAVDAGIPVPGIMDRPGVQYGGQAPDLGAVQTDIPTQLVRRVPITIALAASSVRTVPASISLAPAATVDNIRTVPATIALKEALSVTITDVTIALAASSVRTIPATISLSRTDAPVVVSRRPARRRSVGFPGIRGGR